MRKLGLIVGALLLGAPLAAAAEEGALGAYLWKGGEDTAGIGAKGWFSLGGPVFFSGRLQAGDASDADYNEGRAGIGLRTDLSTGAAVYGGVQAIRIDVEDEDDIGFGLSAGASFAPAQNLTLDVEFGVVDAGELEFACGGPFFPGACTIPLEGSEFSFGAAYALTPQLAVAVQRSEEVLVLVGAVTQVGLRFTF